MNKAALSLVSVFLSNPALATVSIITKVRCEIEFPFNSTEAHPVQLEACLKKLKSSTVTPDHMAIYASASPPGTPAYNFALSKRRSEAISQILAQEFPKAEQEFFPGGVNPQYGQKAIVVASISSPEPLFLSSSDTTGWLHWHRLELKAGQHILKDDKAIYKAVGTSAAVRSRLMEGLLVETGLQLIGLQAEDYYDQFALSADFGPVYSWAKFDLMPKVLLRGLANSKGTEALDIGVKLSAAYGFTRWATSLELSESLESREMLVAMGRVF